MGTNLLDTEHQAVKHNDGDFENHGDDNIVSTGYMLLEEGWTSIECKERLQTSFCVRVVLATYAGY